MKSIWILDDDPGMRWVLEKALDKAGWPVRCFTDGNALVQAVEALTAIEDARAPALVVSDVRMPGLDGFQVLSRIRAHLPDLPVILMTAYTDLDTTVAAFAQGAFDYLAKPFDIEAALALIARAADNGSAQAAGPGASADRGLPLAARAAGAPPRRPPPAPRPGPMPAGLPLRSDAPVMQEVFRAIGRLARSAATVLITGESGTGKELIARALHQHSRQAAGPFIAVNAAAIPRDLLEAELFGHERGAFTGAVQMRRGRFEEADGGTLFLDEIGDMPAELQTRLLRVLSESSFYRVGGSRPIQVAVRIVAATHQPLEDRVREGRFRADLFYRLNVIRLRLPPLRQRREDIEPLALLFLRQAAQQLQVPARVLSPEALRALRRFDYPGNIRQLESICQWLTVMCRDAWVRVEDLPPELLEGLATSDGLSDAPADGPPDAAPNGMFDATLDGMSDAAPSSMPDAPAARPTAGPPIPPAVGGEGGAAQAADWRQALGARLAAHLRQADPALYDCFRNDFDRVVLRQALRHTRGHRGQAAALLGIGRNTLTRKCQTLGLDETAPRGRPNPDDLGTID